MFQLCSVFPKNSQHSRSSLQWMTSLPLRRNSSMLGPSSDTSESCFLQNVRVFLSGFAAGTHPMNSVEEIGARSLTEPPIVTPEAIATICYTSVRPLVNAREAKSWIHVFQGTTGNPKGAILTQGALAAATYSNTCGMDVGGPSVIPVLLSFLPLAHIYGVFFPF